MADKLEVYYSSGSLTTNEYSGEPKKSIGGMITGTKVPSGSTRNLFGTISLKMLSEGSSDYRLIFIKNDGTEVADNVSLLSVYANVPLVSSVTDPDDLVPVPVEGDKWIVPVGGEGAWKDKDGKLATYTSGAWVFTFSNFGNYEFGFVATSVATLDDGTEVKAVDTINNVFTPPGGVVFVSADGDANKVQIGDGNLDITNAIGMWIKRNVPQFPINNDDLELDEGGIVLDEEIEIVLTYDTP